MELKILVVSGNYIYKNDFQKSSLRRNVVVDYTKTMTDAINILTKTDYNLLAICSDYINDLSSIKVMQKIWCLPILFFTYDESLNDSGISQNRLRSFKFTLYNTDSLEEHSGVIDRYYVENKTNFSSLTVFSYNHLKLIVETHQVFYKETKLYLTKKEFDLLKLFMANKGVIFTYEQIYNNIWGYENSYETNNVLHSLVRRLRKKLKFEPDSAEYITSVWGVGYKFASYD